MIHALLCVNRESERLLAAGFTGLFSDVYRFNVQLCDRRFQRSQPLLVAPQDYPKYVDFAEVIRSCLQTASKKFRIPNDLNDLLGTTQRSFHPISGFP